MSVTEDSKYIPRRLFQERLQNVRESISRTDFNRLYIAGVIVSICCAILVIGLYSGGVISAGGPALACLVGLSLLLMGLVFVLLYFVKSRKRVERKLLSELDALTVKNMNLERDLLNMEVKATVFEQAFQQSVGHINQLNKT